MSQSTRVLSLKRREDRRVAVATLVGTSIEWYDFFIYANAAALVFAPLFFEPFVQSLGDVAGRLISFATVGVSFFFRPLGAMVAGHLGDRLGRKGMLVLTLLLMGGATALIGVLPTYATIGITAPALLVLLRILQGFSAGGEWGGAALMAVEHAPDSKRGLFGAFPQVGVPIGMLLASGVLGLVTATTTEEQFLAWGWRLPFLLSIVLVGVGLAIRLGITESPVFKEIAESGEKVRMPLVKLFRFNGRELVLGALTFAANNGIGYMIVGGYLLSYMTADLGMDRSLVLLLVMAGSVSWGVATMAGGIISDRIGRTATYKIGFVLLLAWVFPLFWLIDTGEVWAAALAIVVLPIGLGLSYGPQPALFAEMFPARIRYSGAGLAYAFGAIIGGAFAPFVATWLQARFATSAAVSTYLFVLAAIAFVATFFIKDRTGAPLGRDALDIPGAARLEEEVELAPATTPATAPR